MSELRDLLINISEEKREKIIPENIKEGVTIFGVGGTHISGIDTSGGTAQKTDIAKNKIAYVNDAEVIGTLNELQNNTLDVGYANQTILEDTYNWAKIYSKMSEDWIIRNGSQILTKVKYPDLVDLIGIKAEDVKQGIKYLGVTGTYAGLDTSDGNAEKNDIIKDKVAYVNGQRVVGTLETLADGTAINASGVSISAEDNTSLSIDGTFSNGGVLASNSTIHLMAKNDQIASAIGLAPDIIKSGASVLGIDGTYDSNPEDYNSKFQVPEGLTKNLSPAVLLVSVESLDTSTVTQASNIFNGCTSLKSLPEMDLSNATTVYQLCRNCYNLVYVPNLSLPKCTQLDYAFYNCSNLSFINLDAPKVTYASGVFENCSNLQVAPNINFANVTSMTNTFLHTNIASIDLHNPTNCNSYSRTFYNCPNLKTVINMASGSNGNASDTFYNCTNLTNFINMNLRAEHTDNMFYNCSNLVDLSGNSLQMIQPYGYSATMNCMFYECRNLTTLPDNFMGGNGSSRVYGRGLERTFYNCTNLSFEGHNKFTVHMGSSSGSTRTFYNCRNLDNMTLSFANYFTGDNKTSGFEAWFSGCSNLKWVDFNELRLVSSMNLMFENCSSLTNVTFTNRQCSFTGTSMFTNCTSLASLSDIVGLNWNSVLYPMNMFHNCTNLANISGFAATNTHMNYTFANCFAMSSLENVTLHNCIMLCTFANCRNFTTLDATLFTNCKTFYSTFAGCSALQIVTNLDTTYTSDTLYGTFKNCTNLTDLCALECGNHQPMHSNSMTPFGSYNMIMSGDLLPLSNLVNVGGFLNYGKSFYIYTMTTNNSSYSLDLYGAPNLTYTSLQNIITNIVNLKTTSYANNPQLIIFANTQYEKLTETDITNITNMGWIPQVYNIIETV